MLKNALFGFISFIITALILLCSCFFLIYSDTHIDIWLNFTALFYISKLDTE